jgi:nicotinamide mononucleotide transporter
VVFSLFEIVGSLTALAYLLLIAKRLSVAWVFYIMSSVLYMFVFWRERLYADSLLQMFFVCLGLHAWKRWSATSVDKVMLTSVSFSKHLIAVVGIAGITGLVGGALYLYTDAGVVAFPDALILVGSVYATVLTVRGVIENWWYWVVINAVTVVLYYQKGLPMTVGLASLYTVISCYGLVQWRRAGQI